MQTILYLHGFHSSPNSEKAQLFRHLVSQYDPNIKLIIPQIDVHPGPAITQVTQLVESHKDNLIGIVGSSLGGYLATYLHNKFELPIVVINPAIKPFELLADYLGPQQHPITGQSYQLEHNDMSQLKQAYSDTVLNPDKVWLLQQEKDEVLDYRVALEHYQGCRVNFEQGGSHAFDGFDRYPIQIVEFLQGNRQ